MPYFYFPARVILADTMRQAQDEFDTEDVINSCEDLGSDKHRVVTLVAAEDNAVKLFDACRLAVVSMKDAIEDGSPAWKDNMRADLDFVQKSVAEVDEHLEIAKEPIACWKCGSEDSAALEGSDYCINCIRRERQP